MCDYLCGREREREEREREREREERDRERERKRERERVMQRVDLVQSSWLPCVSGIETFLQPVCLCMCVCVR